MKFKEKLQKLDACSSATEWVGDRDLKTAWKECKRGEWMLWLINQSNPKITLAVRKKLVLCACDIAETVLKHVPADEKRPADAIRIARAWAKGEKVSIEEVKNVANAAAYAAANAANAANAAAYAAANAAYAANAAAYAAAYAANAAYAAYAAANAAANAAYADIVRRYFKNPPRLK